MLLIAMHSTALTYRLLTRSFSREYSDRGGMLELLPGTRRHLHLSAAGGLLGLDVESEMHPDASSVVYQCRRQYIHRCCHLYHAAPCLDAPQASQSATGLTCRYIQSRLFVSTSHDFFLCIYAYVYVYGGRGGREIPDVFLHSLESNRAC